MSRLLLVAAMVASLWPAGAIAASLIAHSTHKPSASSSATPVTWSRSELDNLLGETHTLVNQGSSSSAMSGIPDHRLASSGHSLVHRVNGWILNDGAAPEWATRLASADEQIAATIAKFATSPSQRTLNAVHAAIRKFNAQLKQ